MPRCRVRERDPFGFPRPGDDYWNDQTRADVALRYPGMEIAPDRDAPGPEGDPVPRCRLPVPWWTA
jgi:hypothetical protein